jgi:hypothetical protein
MYTEGVCRTFVPEGLNDGSQAIHCLGSPALKTRPVRVRYDHVSPGLVWRLWRKKAEREAIILSTGRIMSAVYQAFHAWLPSFSPSGTD